MVINEIRRYAVLANAHLISSLSENEIKRLRTVILFGSVAQGTATVESDVDIFFDVDMPKTGQQKLRIKLDKAIGQFYLSNTALGFKLKGIENELSIKVGKLREWKELRQNIAATGVILYGKYFAKFEGKAQTIVSIERIGKLEGALLNKLYGYKAGNKRYPGLIKKIYGSRLGRAFIIPSEYKGIIRDVFKKYKVDYTEIDISRG